MQKLDLSPNTTPPTPAQQTPNVQNTSPARSAATVTNSVSSNVSQENMQKGLPIIVVILVLGMALAAGSATGFGSYKLFGGKTGGASKQPISQVAGDSIKAGDVFGSQDVKTFKDNAQGYMVAGGVDGEGSHHLVREAADPVYLTSSVTDLDKFIGMEIKVWGETYKAQKAGWLMDVGRVEVVNPKANPPAGAETTGTAQPGD